MAVKFDDFVKAPHEDELNIYDKAHLLGYYAISRELNILDSYTEFEKLNKDSLLDLKEEYLNYLSGNDIQIQSRQENNKRSFNMTIPTKPQSIIMQEIKKALDHIESNKGE